MNVRLGLAITTVLTTCGHWVVAGDDLEGQRLVAQVLARSEAVQSGIVHFTLTHEVRHAVEGTRIPLLRAEVMPDGTLDYLVLDWGEPGDQPGSPPLRNPTFDLNEIAFISKPHTPQEYEIAIAGSDWVMRQPNYPNVELSRSDFAATFTVNTNPDTSLDRNLHVELPRGALEREFSEQPWRRVLRAGTIPTPELTEFISLHASEVNRAGSRFIGGVATEILEWKIEQKDYHDVMGKHVPLSMYESRGAFVRVFVAPSIGFCVPRVEFASGSGIVHHYCEASGFQAVGDSLFFPKKFEYFNWNLPISFRMLFDITHIANINEPLDSSLFEIDVPDGTRVRCSLPGKEAVFITGQDATLSGVDELFAAQLKQLPPQSRKPSSVWGWQRSRILVVVNAVLVFLLLLAWLASRGKLFHRN